MRTQTRSSQGEAGAPRHSGRFAGLPQILAAGALAYGSPLACSSRSQAAVFAPWGDSSTYFLVSNGGFENGSTDWSLSNGAKVVAGNETYHVGGATNGNSLRLPPNSAAESRTLCVSRGEDILRLFVYNPHVSGSILHVDTTVVNPDTGAVGYAAFDVNGDVPSAPWAPTMQLKIPNLLGGSGTEQLTLRFTLRGVQTTWNVDDVYVDPFKSW